MPRPAVTAAAGMFVPSVAKPEPTEEEKYLASLSARERKEYEARMAAAKRVGVSSELTKQQIESIEKSVTDARKFTGKTQVGPKPKWRYQRLDTTTKEGKAQLRKKFTEAQELAASDNMYKRAKGQKLLEVYMPTVQALPAAVVGGVVRGAIGPEAAKKVMPREFAYAQRKHPIAAAIGETGEQIAEFVPTVRGAAWGIKTAKAGAKRLLTKKLAKKAVKEKLEVETRKGAAAVAAKKALGMAPTFGVAGAAMQTKQEIMGKAIADDPVEFDKIAKRFGVDTALGFVFSFLGGIRDPLRRAAQVRNLKKYTGLHQKEIDSFLKSAPKAQEKILERATKVGAIKLARQADEAIQTLYPGATRAKGKALEALFRKEGAPAVRAYRPGTERRVLSKAAQEKMALEVPEPSVEAGIVPYKKFAAAFSRERGVPKPWGAKRGAETWQMANQYDKQAMHDMLDQITSKYPEYVKQHFIEAFNNLTPNIAGLPDNLKDMAIILQKNPGIAENVLISDINKALRAGRVARKRITERILPIQEQAAERAVGAGIKEEEFFKRQQDYLARGYKLFDQPEEYRATKEVIDNFTAHIKSTLAMGKKGAAYWEETKVPVRKWAKGAFKRERPGVPSKQYDAWLKQKVYSFLQDVATGKEATLAFGKEAVTLKPVREAALSTRKDLPRVYRELLGEITDPHARVDLTVAKLNEIYARSNMVNTMLKIPGFAYSEKEYMTRKALGFFPAEEGLTRVRVPEAPGYGKLAGKYITSVPGKKTGDIQLANALVNEAMFARGNTITNNAGLTFLDQINKQWKWKNTVFNPFTHSRNFFGNLPFAILDKNIPGIGKNAGPALRNTAATLRAYIKNPTQMQKHDMWMDLLKRGLIETEYAAGELGAGLSSAEARTLDKFITSFVQNPSANTADQFIAKHLSGPIGKTYAGIENQIRKHIGDFAADKFGSLKKLGTFFDRMQRLPGFRLINRIYNAEDQFYKLYAHNRNVMNGMSRAESATLIDRHYTNYRDVAPAVEFLRKVPLFGAFVTFKAEAARIFYNFAEEAVTAMAAGNPGPAAKFIATVGAPNAMRQSMAQMSEIPDERVAEYDRNAAEWNKGAMYFADPVTGQTRGLAIQSFLPQGDLERLYNVFAGVAKGTTKPGEAMGELREQLLPFDQNAYGALAEFAMFQTTPFERAPAYAEESPWLTYGPELGEAVGPEGVEAIGPLEFYTKGAVIPEWLKFGYKTFFQTSGLADYTHERFRNVWQGVAEGQRSPFEAATLPIGVRFFEPRTYLEAEAARKREPKKEIPRAGLPYEEMEAEEMKLEAKAGRKIAIEELGEEKKFERLRGPEPSPSLLE